MSEVRVDIALSEKNYCRLDALAQIKGRTLEELIIDILTQESLRLQQLLEQKKSFVR